MRKERSYSREEFRRRERILLLGVELAVASLEDVVISKLEWSSVGDSPIQRRDVVQLLERTWPRLDRRYLNEWISRLDLDSEWQVAQAQAGRSPTADDTEE